MRHPPRWRLSPSVLLFVVIYSLLFISKTAAQSLPQITTTDPANLPTAAPSNTATGTDASTTDASHTNSNTDNSDDSSSSATDLPNISSASASSAAASTTDGSDPPKISSTGGLSDLPTLPGGFNYPAPSVPPTANAPYMQRSNLPEGTLFIVVGAVLGFIALAILAWRGLVAWSVNRSVRRAAMQGYGTDSKSLLRSRKKSGMYTQTPGSTMSLEKLGAHHRPTTGASKGHGPNVSLFFSPTAGTGMHTPVNNRNSGYLPAGYYAAGNSAPGGGTGMTHIGGPGTTPSLRPTSQGYSRRKSVEPSLSGSPSLPPSRGGDISTYRLSNQGSAYDPSTSTLNLSAPAQGRTPSAYLEDLFESHHTPRRQSPERRY